jgi:competence protein ComEA
MSEIPRPAAPVAPLDMLRQWLAWFGPVRLAVVSASVLAVGLGGFLLLRPSPPPAEASLPVASVSAGDAPAVSTTTSAPTSVVVHVAGAVHAPGVVVVPAGSRVVDALAASGGPRPDAQLDAMNLAAVLTDGIRVYVPTIGEAVPVGVEPVGVAPDAASPGLLDLNRATAAELDTLPGVGPTTAAAIVAHRQANGPFASVDDLADVRGIGPAKLDALRGLVTV